MVTWRTYWCLHICIYCIFSNTKVINHNFYIKYQGKNKNAKGGHMDRKMDMKTVNLTTSKVLEGYNQAANNTTCHSTLKLQSISKNMYLLNKQTQITPVETISLWLTARPCSVGNLAYAKKTSHLLHWMSASKLAVPLLNFTLQQNR